MHAIPQPHLTRSFSPCSTVLVSLNVSLELRIQSTGRSTSSGRICRCRYLDTFPQVVRRRHETSQKIHVASTTLTEYGMASLCLVSQPCCRPHRACGTTSCSTSCTSCGCKCSSIRLGEAMEVMMTLSNRVGESFWGSIQVAAWTTIYCVAWSSGLMYIYIYVYIYTGQWGSHLRRSQVGWSSDDCTS